MADSHIGVFLTLSNPNFSTKPSVTLNTPPYSAISWPIIIKSLFFFIDCNKPSEIASTNLKLDVLLECFTSLYKYCLNTSFISVFISGIKGSSLKAVFKFVFISSVILLLISEISSSVRSFDSVRNDS